MRLNRFIGDFDLSKKEIEITNLENIKQIKDILRLKIGEKIILSNGKGISFEFSIISIAKNKIICKRIKEIKNSKTIKKVSLYLAILKKENFELAIQKATECGVAEIIPIITERTIKTGLNIVRLEKIIKEASEQSGRNTLPKLHGIIKFENAIKGGGNASALDNSLNLEKIIFHPTNTKYMPNKNTKNISIFIGPEGGFTEKEITLAKNFNFKISSLGPLILRAETAAIIATYRAIQGI